MPVRSTPARAGSTADPRLILCLLNGFQLLRHGQPLPVPSGGQRLLALLALAGPCHRSVAAGTLWPDVSDEHADGSLRTTLWRLHRLLSGLVCTSQHQISLQPALDVDTRRFVTQALDLVDDPSHPSSESPRIDALSVGELLPGWYDDWVVFERERLRQLRMHALEQLSRRLLDEHRFALALEAALEAVRVEPLRESAHYAVISVHLAEGNVVEARRQYTGLRTLLMAELHVEPTPWLTALVTPGTFMSRPPAAKAAQAQTSGSG